MKGVGTLAICPSDWFGVRKSISRAADAYVDIAGARAAIRAHAPDTVVFGGYSSEWRRILRFARGRDCRIVVSIQHTPAFHDFAPAARTALADVIEDFKAGLIDRLETPHAGVARTLSHLGIPCAHRRNTIAPPAAAVRKRDLGPGVHIGLFGSGQSWKNMDTQMLAAALVLQKRHGGALHVQHVADASFVEALGVAYEVHPTMESGAFASLLASMTVNLAATFTETFGYLPVESFLLGVPCLFSPMTAAFVELEPHDRLSRCRVDRIDDPAFLAGRIEDVLASRDEIAAAGKEFCQRHVSPATSDADGVTVPLRRVAQEHGEPPLANGGGFVARLGGFLARRRSGAGLAPLLEAMARIRDATDVLAVTQSHDGVAWLGVNRATHALFPGRVLELPLAMAASRERGHEVQELARQVSALGFAQVIFSGFPACTESLARCVHERGSRVGGLYHGFVAECVDPDLAAAFAIVLRLRREGVIGKLACNKKGLPETIEKITGLGTYAFTVPTRVSRRPSGLSRGAREGLHIGVLGYDLLRKNIHNQVAAALMVDGATVHVAGGQGFAYWGCDDRVRRHPEILPHDEYVELLGQMDLNLHLSFSESWGQLAVESIAMGVPCLTAKHCDIYDGDPALGDRLRSTNLDDPYALSRDIRLVLAEGDSLTERLRSHVDALNQRADEGLRDFLAA